MLLDLSDDKICDRLSNTIYVGAYSRDEYGIGISLSIGKSVFTYCPYCGKRIMRIEEEGKIYYKEVVNTILEVL